MSRARSADRLRRVLKVRGLQLDLARAEEAAAVSAHGSAEALRDRIHALGLDVAPAAGGNDGLNLLAAAHYRSRLQRSGEEALRRVQMAGQKLDIARAATGAARRDHGAVEKLVDRALDVEAAAARRAMEDAPQPVRPLARSLQRDG